LAFFFFNSNGKENAKCLQAVGKGVLPAHGAGWECKIILLNCSNFLPALSVVMSQYLFKDISLLVSWELLYKSKRNASSVVS